MINQKHFSIIVCALFLLTACAHFGTPDPQSALEQRVAAHWHAKQAQQWDVAYDYFCPAVKAKQTRVRYIQSANLEISAFRIENMVLSEDKRSSEVTIVFDTIMQGFQFNNMQLKEQWYNEGNGWCIGPQGGIKSLFSN
jgi:hypothetical protein